MTRARVESSHDVVVTISSASPPEAAVTSRSGIIRGVAQTWGRILTGRQPNLSIEITRECPLRCPGCYAFGEAHLGGDVTLRDSRTTAATSSSSGSYTSSTRAIPCTCPSSAASRSSAIASSAPFSRYWRHDTYPHSSSRC